MKGLFTILIILSCASLLAHPHAFGRASSTLQFNALGIESVEIILEWDKMYSASLLSDYDTDNDGAFSMKEVDSIQSFFKSFDVQQYFVDVRINDKRLQNLELSFFDAIVINGKVTFEYKVMIHSKIEINQKIEFSVYDQEYFHDISYNSSSMFIDGGDFFNLKFSYSAQDKSKSYYMDQIDPNVLVIHAKPVDDA